MYEVVVWYTNGTTSIYPDIPSRKDAESHAAHFVGETGVDTVIVYDAEQNRVWFNGERW